MPTANQQVARVRPKAAPGLLISNRHADWPLAFPVRALRTHPGYALGVLAIHLMQHTHPLVHNALP